MTKEQLQEAFNLMDRLDTILDKLEELNIDLTETDLSEIPGLLFDLLVSSNYIEDGQDWINWWYFEKGMLDPSDKAYDENGKEIETFDDLYEVIKPFER